MDGRPDSQMAQAAISPADHGAGLRADRQTGGQMDGRADGRTCGLLGHQLGH
jgi:hypothetical protein